MFSNVVFDLVICVLRTERGLQYYFHVNVTDYVFVK